MKRLLLVLILAFAPGCSAEGAQEEAIAKALPTVVHVQTTDTGGSCAGVVLDAARGRVISAKHCLSLDKNRVYPITLVDGTVVHAKAAGADPQIDIAVFEVVAGERDKLVAARVSTTLRAGMPVVAIGHPMDLDWSATGGIVSHPRRYLPFVDAYFVQIDAAINPGNSGGGIFDNDGQLIGILSLARVAAGGGPRGLAFAVRTVDVLEAVRKLDKAS